jgi:hypothetical protein
VQILDHSNDFSTPLSQNLHLPLIIDFPLNRVSEQNASDMRRYSTRNFSNETTLSQFECISWDTDASKWTSAHCKLKSISGARGSCECLVAGDLAVSQIIGTEGDSYITVRDSQDHGASLGDGVIPAATFTFVCTFLIAYAWFFKSSYLKYYDTHNKWTIHPIYSIVRVHSALAPRPVRLLLYFGTISVQAHTVALALKYSGFGIDLEYSDAIMSSIPGLCLSFMINYCMGLLCHHYIPISKLPLINKTYLRVFYRIMITAEAILMISSIGVCFLLTRQGGVVWMIAVAGSLIFDSILDVFMVLLSQRINFIFTICQLRGFYVEYLANYSEVQILGERLKRRV